MDALHPKLRSDRHRSYPCYGRIPPAADSLHRQRCWQHHLQIDLMIAMCAVPRRHLEAGAGGLLCRDRRPVTPPYRGPHAQPCAPGRCAYIFATLASRLQGRPTSRHFMPPDWRQTQVARAHWMRVCFTPKSAVGFRVGGAPHHVGRTRQRRVACSMEQG